MFKFLKSKKTTDQTKSDEQSVQASDEAAESPSSEQPQKRSWLSRLNAGLKRTRSQLSDGLANLVLGKKSIDDELLEELETLLLMADVGVDATEKIIDELTTKVKRKELTNPETLMTVLREQLKDMLTPFSQPLDMQQTPFVLLMTGVNGAGKTTSIAKIANFYKQQGKSVMLAAGDTFRAAAVEQLQVWGERNDVPVIAQHTGADSASVIFDAMQAATARGVDILIADTAGRLHTQEHLMRELEKITRVIKKHNPDAPHETMLVLDAGMGQNALNQAREFNKSIGLTGLTLTKLDGTAKGGIIFAITEQLSLPIRFIGVGETIDDLQPFDAEKFCDALFQTAE